MTSKMAHLNTSAPAFVPQNKDDVLQGLIKVLSEVEVKLHEQQADTKSPLFSARSFEDLELCAAVRNGPCMRSSAVLFQLSGTAQGRLCDGLQSPQ